MFKKFLNKVPTLEINRFKFIFFTSLYFAVIYNIPYIINKFINNTYNDIAFKHNIKILTSDILIAFIFIVLLLLIFSFSKYVLKFLIVLFFILSSFFAYSIYEYKVIVDEIFLLNLTTAAADINAKDYIKIIPVFFILGLGIIPSLYIIYFVKVKSYSKSFSFKVFLVRVLKNNLVSFIILPLILCLIFLIRLDKDLNLKVKNVKRYIRQNYLYSNNYLPLNYLYGTYKLIKLIKRDKLLFNNKVYLYDKYDFKFNSLLKDKPLTIVLVIGESSRAQNQAYNGYFRDTNKYTKNIQDLIYLKDVKSCNTYTYGSVPCMLSYRTRADFNFQFESSLISVFRHLGFKTYWISSQNTFWVDVNPLTQSAVEASEVTFVNFARSGNGWAWDEPQVLDKEVYNKFVIPAIYSKFKQKLIIFQLEGSHLDYRYRFPENFMVYTPSAKLNPSVRNAIIDRNDYDNTVIYTDYILSLLIKELKDQNALVLYMSDHGESLAVDKSGFVFHSTPFDKAPKEQTQVAALMWLSKGMQKLLPNALANIKKYSELPISHDYVFSTLLGSIGVESEVINKKLDLTSSAGIPDAKLGKYR